jgi:uncharacterized membrane protein YphA (DoxX/SURF4 family)
VRWVSLLVRFGLAAVFFFAGASKVTDLDASGRAVIAYELLPAEVAMIVGTVLPFVEISLGLLLLLGLATRLAAWVATAMLVVFISAIVSAWARGLNIDCGCFSQGGHLPEGQTANYLPEILRDLAFLSMAIFLIIFPASRFSLDGWLLASNATEGDADDG